MRYIQWRYSSHARRRVTKNTKKNSQDWRISIEISKKRKGRKASKINYESKYISHENLIEDEALKIKKKRTPLFSLSQLNTIFYDKLHIALGNVSFDIPEDLLIEVLLRLPLKSLARFKCVSKTLHRLISNLFPMPNRPKLFIFSRWEERHYSVAHMKRFHYWHYPRYYSYSYSFYSLDDKTNVEKVHSPAEEHLLRDHKVKIHSSCNGLLLMQIDDELFLWNPLTTFLRRVLDFGDIIYRNAETRIEVDLCFCSVKNEYEIVLVVKSWSGSYSTQDFYVATSRAPTWKKIKIYLDNVFPGPFFKGYRHWICICYRSTFHETIPIRKSILYFEPSTDKFIEVAKPQPKEGDRDTFLSLGACHGCLCITHWDDLGNYQGNIELLVMKEYGNGNSWEVMFVFSNSPEFRSYGSMEPLFKTKGGEVWVAINMYDNSPSGKAYDVHDNFIRDVWATSVKDPKDDYHYHCKIILYEQNWFSPTGYD